MSIYSLGASKNNSSNLKSTTKVSLETLGIDSSMVTSEDEAQSIIDRLKEAQAASAENLTKQQDDKNSSSGSDYNSDTQLTEAKTLASIMGISVSSNDTLNDILASISAKIDEFLSSPDASMQSLGRAYQAQLAGITSSSKSAYAGIQSNSSQQRIYSAMDIIAQNNRYFLNL